jgi:2-polyprenyl-3-methyl-5-hydroxy-6-metoxy-1,4-benzoquinol methylase
MNQTAFPGETRNQSPANGQAASLEPAPGETRAYPAELVETADIETSSDDYARRFAGPIGEWFLRIQREATLHMLAPYPGATVLDVGGGHGQIAGALVQQGYAVTVLGSAEVCQQRILPLIQAGQCAFKVGDVTHLPYPDQSFEVVVSYRLLPHVTRWQQLLAELCRVARRAVIVDYPSLKSVNSIAPQLFKYKKQLEGNTRPYTCFREEELLSVVEPLSFRRAERYAEFFVPMVLHRALKSPRLSAVLEAPFRWMGLVNHWGSPIIIKFVHIESVSHTGSA